MVWPIWLAEYSVDYDAAFCFSCRHFASAGGHGFCLEPAFTIWAFQNWRKAQKFSMDSWCEFTQRMRDDSKIFLRSNSGDKRIYGTFGHKYSKSEGPGCWTHYWYVYHQPQQPSHCPDLRPQMVSGINRYYRGSYVFMQNGWKIVLYGYLSAFIFTLSVIWVLVNFIQFNTSKFWHRTCCLPKFNGENKMNKNTQV